MNKALELERHKLYKAGTWESQEEGIWVVLCCRRGRQKEEKLCGTGSILVRPLVWMCTDFMAQIIRLGVLQGQSVAQLSRVDNGKP